jgi:hypothetical protein
MGFDFAAAKSLLRQTVHDTLAVEAFFKFNADSNGVDITARYHSGIVKQGQVEGEGAERYADVTQVVFDRNALMELGIEPEHGNIVEFPLYDVVVYLDVKLPYDGPVEEKWLVTLE